MARLLLLSLFLWSCGSSPGFPLESTLWPVEKAPPPVDLSGPAAPAQAVLVPRGNRSGYFPLALKSPVSMTLPAGSLTSARLPISSSAEAVIVTARSTTATNLIADGQLLKLTAKDAATLVVLPVVQAQLLLTSTEATTLELTVLGVFDQTGAGLAPEVDLPRQYSLQSSENRLDALSTEDDTWGRFVEVRAETDADQALLSLGVCDTAPSETLAPRRGAPASVVTLLPAGRLCVSSTQPAKLIVTPVIRFARFADASWQRFAPVTLLDTEKGVAWRGTPAAKARIEVPLSGLTGLTPGATGALQLTTSNAPDGATVAIGACDGLLQTVPAEGRLVLFDVSRALCVVPSDRFEVKLELVAQALPGDAHPSVCRPRPAAQPCAGQTLLERLNCVAGVRAQPAPTSWSPEAIMLTVTQPVDHSRPDGATFTQRVRLVPRSPDAPWVMNTTGYMLFDHVADLTLSGNFNELQVEHRYFAGSTPRPTDYRYLTIVQSAYDTHRLVELLRPVLGGAWAGTGHSKGGMTALFHRRFFPCDVDATVPYVTPVSLGLPDLRYGPFLDRLGGPRLAECRNVFKDIDRAVIQERAIHAPRLRGTYSRIGSPERALWATTGLTSWAHFQYGLVDDPMRGCPAYLSARQSPAYFAQLVSSYAAAGERLSDEALSQSVQGELFGYTYQTANELGVQGHSRDYLADLAPVPLLPSTSEISLPPVPVPKFEPRAMEDILRWVSRHGERLLFIYGELDPWTAGAVPLGQAHDSFSFIVPNAFHGARLTELPAAELTVANNALTRWLSAPMPMPSPKRAVIRHEPEFRDVMEQYGL